MEYKQEEKKLSPFRHALRSALWVVAVIAGIFIFSYGFAVTQINLEEPQDPKRQEVTTRVIRALARPDFFEYHEETRSMDVLIRMPCPEEISGAQTSIGERVVILKPNCASTTQDLLTMDGSGFRPRTNGILRWHAAGAVATTRALSTFRTDSDGNFQVEFTMPDIRPTDEPQRIEVEEKWRPGFLFGIKGPSETVIITLKKIVETIFLALIATLVGTILAVPISFLAARNLMENVNAPIASVAAAIIAIPIGWFIGSQMARFLIDLAERTFGQPLIGLGLALIAGLLAWLLLRIGPPVFSDEPQPRSRQIVSMVRLILASMLAFLSIALLANLGVVLGAWLETQLGRFGFIGNFIFLISESIRVLSPMVVGFFLALIAATFGSKYGQELVLRTSGIVARLFTAVIAGFGTAVFIYGIGAALNWLYQFDDPQRIYFVAIAGGIIMA